MTNQVVMEIRRLVVESEAEQPAKHGSSGGITFSAGSVAAGGKEIPRLLKRPAHLKQRSAG